MSDVRVINGTAFELHGLKDAPVIVLIHGLGLCRHLWRDHLPALTQKYRVLNYDLYGHGDSDPSPHKATLQVYSDQLADLMTALDISKATIVGFSIGGMINRRFARDHAKRLSGLVILNAPHGRGPEAQKAVEERAAIVGNDGALATMDAALTRWFTPAFRAENPDVMQSICDWRMQADPKSYAQAAWVLAAGVTELIDPPFAITAPSLVMTCENDTGSTIAMTHAIGTGISGSEVVIIPHYQHLGLIEAPDLFTAPIVGFLARTMA